jgi:indolepyruvate ferredoxin oxidoreductase beta subunit
MSYRYARSSADRALARAVAEAATRDAGLAFEVAECARLVKGYGETHRRGKGNFLAIARRAGREPGDRRRARAGAAIRKAREAALADPKARRSADAGQAGRLDEAA